MKKTQKTFKIADVTITVGEIEIINYDTDIVAYYVPGYNCEVYSYPIDVAMDLTVNTEEFCLLWQQHESFDTHFNPPDVEKNMTLSDSNDCNKDFSMYLSELDDEGELYDQIYNRLQPLAQSAFDKALRKLMEEKRK